MDEISSVIKELAHQQRVLGLGEKEFAGRLGISRSQWVLIKSGAMEPGFTLLAGAAFAFPGLKEIIFLALQAKGRERAAAA